MDLREPTFYEKVPLNLFSSLVRGRLQQSSTCITFPLKIEALRFHSSTSTNENSKKKKKTAFLSALYSKFNKQLHLLMK